MSKAAELAALIANVNNGSSLANKNLIINGAMNVAQRGTSATGVGSTNSYPTVDRFKVSGFGSTAGRLTMEQVADGPSGFANCTKLTCTTADTSIGAGEGLTISQDLEGQDLQQLKKGTSDAVPITVSFWVKGNASATYTCELRDADNSRFNSQAFSVTTSWNRIELTFAGDTTGALDDDTSSSLQLFIWLHAGSTYTGGTHTSNAWHTTANQRVVDSQTSFCDSTSRTFFITGVQMEIGKATPFEHEPFETTLAKCQRYFCRTYTYGVATGTATVLGAVVTQAEASTVYSGSGTWRYPAEMRAAPTITAYSTQNADTTGKTTADGTDGTATIYGIGAQSAFICRHNDSSGVVANAFLKAHATASAEL